MSLDFLPITKNVGFNAGSIDQSKTPKLYQQFWLNSRFNFNEFLQF